MYKNGTLQNKHRDLVKTGVSNCAKESNASYVWSQSEKFDDHLNSEECGEDHVQDVHDRVEALRLLIVLMAQKM